VRVTSEGPAPGVSIEDTPWSGLFKFPLLGGLGGRLFELPGRELLRVTRPVTFGVFPVLDNGICGMPGSYPFLPVSSVDAGFGLTSADGYFQRPYCRFTKTCTSVPHTG